MNNLLFNAPFWAPLLLGAIGVFVFFAGNRRQQVGVRSAGLAIVLLAVVYAGVSYFVDTPAERAEKGTRAFVQGVIAKDSTALSGLLDPMAALTVLGSATPYSNREAITTNALAAVDQYGIKSANILTLTSEVKADAVIVTIDVLSDQEATYGRPMTTSWQFEWEPTNEGLLITRITCLRIGEASGDAALGRFPSVGR